MSAHPFLAKIGLCFFAAALLFAAAFVSFLLACFFAAALSLLDGVNVSSHASQDKKQSGKEHHVALDAHRKAGGKQQHAQHDECHPHAGKGSQ